MRNAGGLFCLMLAGSATVHAQGRPLDWPFYGGDAQRSGWEKTDSRITRDNVKDFTLVLKRKLEKGGAASLTPPVVIGNLISYKGFKELAFIAGSSGSMWSIDVDTDRVFWQKRLSTGPSGSCEGVTAVPSLTPPLNFAARPRPPAAAAGAPRSPGAPPTPAGAPPATPVRTGILGTGAFGAPRPAFAVSSDGKLHLLNTSTGDDLVPPIAFIPAGAKASSLAIADGVIYTTTSSDCGGQTGVWALNLAEVDPKDSSSTPKPASFLPKSGTISTIGGLAFGSDGTVYVQTSSALFALAPKDLRVKQTFPLPGAKNPATPVVFARNGQDLIAAAGANGALYLFDSKSQVYKSPALTASGQGVWGGLSSWQEADGTRWVLAPVWGALNPELGLTTKAAHGSVVAFKVEDRNGTAALTPAWASSDLNSPQPPVIASGIVFALASTPHATLHALDAVTGEELYSTGNQVTAPANLTGITVANGRVYFTTTDGTLYAFGIFLER